MTDDRAMDLHQFGAYTESIDMGPVCLCARQGTDLSAPFGPALPASHLDEVFRGTGESQHVHDPRHKSGV